METVLSKGIYPPLPTFFTAQEELDLHALKGHMERLADTGIAGYVLLGSNGEAVHLSDEERGQVIEAAYEVCRQSALELPLIVGCGAQSTRATIAYCQQAARAGADMALVLPPFYYKSRMDRQALLSHYERVANESPLPVLLYNMPGAAAGLDLDAALIAQLAEHPNIVGVKDSSGNITKLTEVVSLVPAEFSVLAGNAGFFLAALAIGASGTITALANVFPYEVCLVQALFEAGEWEEARALQARLIPVNAAVTTQFGVPGLKAALELTAGYGGSCRQPLQPLSVSEAQRLAEIVQRFSLENTATS